MESSTTYKTFLAIGVAEGISFLLLLGVAMPLKYLAHIPIAVTIAGSLHGVLFIAFLVLSNEVKGEPVVLRWKEKRPWLLSCFLAAILPFGTFVLEKKLLTLRH